MNKIFVAVCLLLTMVGSASARNCTVPGFRTLDNQTVDGYMTVRTGKRCFIRMNRSPGPIFSAHIVARPAHGTLGVTSNNRIVYQSRRGYVGSDSFIYARRGLDTRNNPITRTMRIDVTVTR
jgi:hypothetical protein